MQIIRIVWQTAPADTARLRSFGEDLVRLSWSEPHYHVDADAVGKATDTIEFSVRRSMIDGAVAATELLLNRHGLSEVCRIDTLHEP